LITSWEKEGGREGGSSAPLVLAASYIIISIQRLRREGKGYLSIYLQRDISCAPVDSNLVEKKCR